MSKYSHLPYRPCAGVMLLNSEGQVFVGQRLDSTLEAWQMPQGGIDPGEDPLEAAYRELWEETGRWAKFGGQLLKIKDRKEAEYAYGPTHGEVVTDGLLLRFPWIDCECEWRPNELLHAAHVRARHSLLPFGSH